MNRTDMRCLGVPLRTGPMLASELADASGLTQGAMTTALDRMEDTGYVRRVRDTEDRRGVRVEVTGAGRRKVDAIYGPIAAEGNRLLSKYSIGELEAILRFLSEARALQQAHVERIRKLRPGRNG